MLSHEERIAEVKRRIAEKEHQKRLRQARIAAVSGVAACLAVIVGVSLFMPGIVEQKMCIRDRNHRGRPSNPYARYRLAKIILADPAAEQERFRTALEWLTEAAEAGLVHACLLYTSGRGEAGEGGLPCRF